MSAQVKGSARGGEHIIDLARASHQSGARGRQIATMIRGGVSASSLLEVEAADYFKLDPGQMRLFAGHSQPKISVELEARENKEMASREWTGSGQACCCSHRNAIEERQKIYQERKPKRSDTFEKKSQKVPVEGTKEVRGEELDRRKRERRADIVYGQKG